MHQTSSSSQTLPTRGTGLMTQTPECASDVVNTHQSSEKTTKYTASCSTSKKHAWKNWHHVPLSPHNFCDRSTQRPISNCRTHDRWSYLARPRRAVYNIWWNDMGCMWLYRDSIEFICAIQKTLIYVYVCMGFLNGMVTGQFQYTQLNSEVTLMSTGP